jgi:hypothetical protein
MDISSLLNREHDTSRTSHHQGYNMIPLPVISSCPPFQHILYPKQTDSQSVQGTSCLIHSSSKPVRDPFSFEEDACIIFLIQTVQIPGMRDTLSFALGRTRYSISTRCNVLFERLDDIYWPACLLCLVLQQNIGIISSQYFS